MSKFCRVLVPSLAIVLNLLFDSSVWARTYDIYRADYTKGAFCAAIGGACASDNDPENSFFQNPAAMNASYPDFIFDGDYNNSSNLEPGMKSSNDVTEKTYMGGLGFIWKRFGVGAAMTARKHSVRADATLLDNTGTSQNFEIRTDATTFLFNVPFSLKLRRDLAVGIALLGIYYMQDSTINNGASIIETRKGSLPRFSFSMGGLYQLNPYIRFGSWFRYRLTDYVTVTINTQPGSNALPTYQEDMALTFPWVLANGISWMPWGDDRTLLFDANLIGSTPDGYLLSYGAFTSETTDRNLLKKGRKIVIEPRLGYRSPWYPGSRGTFLLGTYWENSRWENIPGRIHGTAGVSYHIFSWFELLGGVDVAKDFFQLLITFR